MNKATRIALLEGNIKTFRARMASSADKDGLRRQIAACKTKIKELKEA